MPVDYCTLSPDRIGSHVISACCQAHDHAYNVAATLAEKLQADVALGRCIAAFDGWQMDAAGWTYATFTAVFGTVFWLRARWRRSTPLPQSTPRPAAKRAGLFRAISPEITVDRKAFYDAVRPKIGALTQANVDGFERYLDEGWRRNTALDRLAYILATVFWETGRTMQPVKEAFFLGGRAEAFRRKLRYYPWYGRGDIQLTWEENYRMAGEAIGVDLIKNPDAALDPKNAVRIAFEGMEKGWFTGKDVGDFLDGVDESDEEDLREFANARRVVNGTDKQIEIGQLALAFENALRVSGYAASHAVAPIVLPAPVNLPSAPTPIGHNGGPPLAPDLAIVVLNKDLTPVQETHKANQGAIGATLGSGGVGAGLVYLWSLTSYFPAEWAGDPQAIIVLTGIASAICAAPGAWIASYRAPDKRFTPIAQ